MGRWQLPMGARGAVAGVVALALGVSGCGGSSTSPDTTSSTTSTTIVVERPLIVVTHSILSSVVAQIVGDVADVRTLIPDGSDPHDYAPTAREIEALSQADLIVRNGGGFDESLDRVVNDAEKSGVSVFAAIEYVTSPPEGAGDDPHFFTDPESMKQVVMPLAAEITKATGLQVSDDASILIADLDAVSERMSAARSRLDTNSPSPIDCVLITGHESLAYIAARYDCKVLGAVIPGRSSSAEATAADIAKLKRQAEDERVGAIFVESTLSSRVAEQLASELGVEVVTLDVEMLGDARSYQEYVETLMTAIVEGLLPL